MTLSSNSYKILNSKAMVEISDEKKAATAVLDSVGLVAEKFRVGNTKVLHGVKDYEIYNYVYKLYFHS